MRPLRVLDFLKSVYRIRNWPWFILDYCKLASRRQTVYTTNEGLSLKARKRSLDATVISQIFLSEDYVTAGVDIEEGDKVLDIGGHAGFFAIFASRKTGDRGKVYSFEPVRENFEMMKANLKANSIRNVVAINKAISGRGGRRDIYVHPTKKANHSFLPRLVKNGVKFSVDSVGLKEFLEKVGEIDFLKMDVEGAEYEILEGMDEETFGRIRKISMEYHNLDSSRNRKTIENLLQKNGFTVKVAPIFVNHGMIYASRSS